MRQVLVLRIHADGTLVLACLLGRMLGLEGVEVALLLNHLQRLDREHVLIAFLVDGNIHLLKSDGIVKTLFVDDITEDIVLASKMQARGRCRRL